MSRIYELPIPYDVLVAATEIVLSESVSWLEFEKIHETPGSTTYRLWEYLLGDIGKMRVRKLGEKLSEILVVDPPHPTDGEGLKYYMTLPQISSYQIGRLPEGSPPPLYAAIVLLSNATISKDNEYREWQIDWPGGISIEAERKIIRDAKKIISEGRKMLEMEREERLEKAWQAYRRGLVTDQRLWQLNEVAPPPYIDEFSHYPADWEIALEDFSLADIIHWLNGKITEGEQIGNETPNKPTAVTEMRAELFREIKNEHPSWTQDRVAAEACKRWGVENITGSTVRNAYRAMRKAYPDQAEKWAWERGDRIR